MKTSHIVAMSASVLLVGGLTAAGATAEINAQHDRENIVRTIVAAVAPDASTSDINIHGRPLFPSDEGTVSTAYVDVTADDLTTQWIIQDYRDDVIGLLDIYVPVDLPGQPTPLPAADGSYSNRGTVDNVEITYDATLTDGILTVTADGTPVATVDTPEIGSVDTVHPYVNEDGLSVNLQARNLTV